MTFSALVLVVAIITVALVIIVRDESGDWPTAWKPFLFIPAVWLVIALAIWVFSDQSSLPDHIADTAETTGASQ